MRNRKTIGVLGLSLIGFGLYWFRRQVLGRLLRLPPPRYPVTKESRLLIPVGDGVSLAADRYAPKAGRLFPTILIRTPYGRARGAGGMGLTIAFVAQRLAERGYNVVVQDVRGRYDSGGEEFEPFLYETADGHATLQWIEQQPWFNGLIGMWGQSYLGYTQWAAATGAPPYVKALVPAFTGAGLPIMGFRDHALGLDTLFRWILELDTARHPGWLAGVSALRNLAPVVQQARLERAFRTLPLRRADQALLGQPLNFYQGWLDHPDLRDPYWKARQPAGPVGHITAASHLVGGWHDILLRELLEDYAAQRLSGLTPYLTIGPWTHLDTDGWLEALRQGIVWFDAFLKGDRRQMRPNPVQVFVMGGAGWRALPDWPPPAQPQRFYLHGDKPRRGSLDRSLPAENDAPDMYIYDPRRPTPAIGGAMMNLQAGSRDNRALEARPDVLVFTTAPLEQNLEVIGAVKVELYVRSSRAFTDFFVRLCDVSPNQHSLNVCDGLLRVEPGIGQPQADGSLRLEFELWPTAYRFAAGHCLRVQVSSGAFPRWSRNPGSGEPLAAATQLLPAEQRIFHDFEHPSAVILPVT